MALSVEFELTGVGWMDIRFTNDGKSYAIGGLSYLTPVLDDILRATLAICGDATRGDASFALEPGTARLRFERAGGRQSAAMARLDIAQRDIFAHPADEDFERGWAFHVRDVDVLASAVLAGAKALEARHGRAGYLEKWVEYPFPAREMEALESAIGDASQRATGER